MNMVLLLLLLLPWTQGLPQSLTSTIEGRRQPSNVQVAEVMERMERLADFLDEEGHAKTDEFRLQQTLLIYKDLDEQLSQLFADIIRLKAVLAASVLLEDRDASYRHVGNDLSEVEQSLRRTARSFEYLMEFSRTVRDADSYRLFAEEGVRLFDDLMDSVVAIKRHLRTALSTQSPLRLKPIIRALGTNGDFKGILYAKH